MRVGDALDNEDGLMDGSTDGAALGFSVVSEVGIQEGTIVGASLELGVGDALGNDDGLMDGATDDA